MLTPADLASLRAVTAEALPGTAILQTQAWTSDGGGGGTTAWTASGTVACRLAPVIGPGMREEQVGGRIQADTQFIVTLPADTSVTTNSRILTAGGTFNVEAIRERSWNVTTRVECKKAA